MHVTKKEWFILDELTLSCLQIVQTGVRITKLALKNTIENINIAPCHERKKFSCPSDTHAWVTCYHECFAQQLSCGYTGPSMATSIFVVLARFHLLFRFF